jgi:hypothetical protein
MEKFKDCQNSHSRKGVRLRLVTTTLSFRNLWMGRNEVGFHEEEQGDSGC